MMGTAGPALGTGGKGSRWRQLMAKSSVSRSFLVRRGQQQCWGPQRVRSGSSLLSSHGRGGQWYRRPQTGQVAALSSSTHPPSPAQLCPWPGKPCHGLGTLCQACFYMLFCSKIRHDATGKCRADGDADHHVPISA